MSVNAGRSSAYFNIERGLRQGSPLSTGIFNLAVEILWIAIREKKTITGITIDGKDKKHAQYADDLWAVIKAEPKIYEELMNTFEQFGELSGLKINFDKTQVIRLGSFKHSTESFQSKYDVTWTDYTKILGLYVMADRKQMIQKNYDELLVKMKATLNPWRARSSTLIGRITVLNALIMSQTVYKILSLNSPNGTIASKIKKLVIDFIWEGKK